MTRVLGIDLGTSRSAAAVLDGGEIRDIPPAENDGKPGSFPSVVSFFEDGGCLIGGPALEQSIYNPQGTITGIKRKIGTGETVEIFGTKRLPQFVSALILMKIRIDAEKFLGDAVTKAVITVPASFDDIQRQATKDAAKIAGLDTVRLLPEPVAAAMMHAAEPVRMLVFDMGAGTLDVSIVDADSDLLEVMATSGPTNVGGIDIDTEISSWLTKRLDGAKPDEQSTAQISSLAEALKIRLSEADVADFDEILVAGDKQVKLSGSLTRKEFEGMITHILGEGEMTINRVVRDAGIEIDTIRKVVLVGGSTKIPAIRGMVARVLGEPESGADPDLVVARGAAMEGAMLAGDPGLPVLYQGLTLLNVTPLDLAEEAKEDGQVKPVIMIPKNTTYPAEHTRTFYVNNIMQTEVEISVWQGDFEQDPGFVGNVNLGTFTLHELAVGKRNEIEVTYSIDHDGILTVRAAEIGTNTARELVVDRAWEGQKPVGELGFEEIKQHEKKYRDYLSPYEIPVEEQGIRQESTEKTSWMCGCLAEAKRILREHHTRFDPTFLDWARFELFVQLDIQYAYAYIHLTGGPAYPIGIHNALSEDTRENRRSLVITLVHEILHAIHPDWGHNRIRPEERRLANLAGYYDAYMEQEIMFLSGKMSLCNNTVRHGSGGRITCPD